MKIKLDTFWIAKNERGMTEGIFDLKREAVCTAKTINGQAFKVVQVWHNEKCIYNVHESIF